MPAPTAPRPANTVRLSPIVSSLTLKSLIRSLPPETVSNHWLNAIVLESLAERDAFLEYSNGQGVMARPIWRLMHRLAMYADGPHDGLANSLWLEERVVNIPSSVPDGALRSLTP